MEVAYGTTAQHVHCELPQDNEWCLIKLEMCCKKNLFEINKSSNVTFDIETSKRVPNYNIFLIKALYWSLIHRKRLRLPENHMTSSKRAGVFLFQNISFVSVY